MSHTAPRTPATAAPRAPGAHRQPVVHRVRESAEELRRRIPGWGADLELTDRPAVPQELRDPADWGAHWVTPERQQEHEPRERSIEYDERPAVFGTAQPLRGAAGRVKRVAYENFSEASQLHWLLLALGDRLDVAAHRLRDARAVVPLAGAITGTVFLAVGARRLRRRRR